MVYISVVKDGVETEITTLEELYNYLMGNKVFCELVKSDTINAIDVIDDRLNRHVLLSGLDEKSADYIRRKVFGVQVMVLNTDGYKKIKYDRVDKNNYYLDLAETVSKRSTCLRRIYGAVIVNNDEVISTGYVGAPRGRKNCSDLGYCLREKHNIPRGERYELCRSVHAESNAIISAPREKMIGSTLYLVGLVMEHDTYKDVYSIGYYVKDACSCSMCKRLIINAGIETVVIRDTKEAYRVINVVDWVKDDESLQLVKGY